MIREVDLLSYLPDFIQAYKEMRYLMLAENPEIQTAEDETEKVKNNQFVTTCDMRWISNFEKMTGILPDPQSTLEDRRRRVLEKWNASIPYNYARLIERLDGLCWNEGYTIRPDFQDFEIEILVSLIEQGQVRDLEWICETYVPANIKVILTNKMQAYPEMMMGAGGIPSICMLFEAEEEENG